jgi:hypothetical protein
VLTYKNKLLKSLKLKNEEFLYISLITRSNVWNIVLKLFQFLNALKPLEYISYLSLEIELNYNVEMFSKSV